MTPALEAPAPIRSLKDRVLVLRGVRQHTLKNFDLDLPHGRLIVITGPSGSGKSSLAFDTIYAEGQRRYTESLSAYARQFLERMDKPDVDYISGLAPALAIQQSNAVKNPRSTVATQTEIYDYLRLLFARVGKTISPVSGEEVVRDRPRSVAEALAEQFPDGTRLYLTFALPIRKPVKGQKAITLADEAESLLSRGFFRLLVLPTPAARAKGAVPEVVDVNETPVSTLNVARDRVRVLVDRLVTRKEDEAFLSRASDSVEQAFREGNGRAEVWLARPEASLPDVLHFSTHFERDGLMFVEPTPLLFSFNSPAGACPKCQGFGRVPGVDPELVVPNPDYSVRQGALAPFRTEQWSAYFRDLIREAARTRFPIDTPYRLLTDEQKKWLWHGGGEYVGIYGFFSYLESNNYKMHYRIYASRFRGYTTCPTCQGYRVREDALCVKVAGMHIGEMCEMTTGEAQEFFSTLTLSEHDTAVAGRILEEVRKRLRYLVDVGLEYLTLNRLSMTLSGGENQRLHLATSLGSSLVGSLYVLDEPSIGLHPRDSDRLIRILEGLRDLGNTVLVVEHDAEMMRRADFLVDLGPGSGIHGGELVYAGPTLGVLTHPTSLTGAYLSGRERIKTPASRRTPDPEQMLFVEGAYANNLKHINVAFPLGMQVCVTGVSGSGKSTLVHDILYRGLRRLKGFHDEEAKPGPHRAIRGEQRIDMVELVDQSPIGKSSRSNPVSYVKAWDTIRGLLADTHAAKVRGYTPGTFSFNVTGGRCETCQGEGVVKVEMQFLADLYLECDDCRGKRFKQEVLEVRYKGKNVYDILRMPLEEAVSFFSDAPALSARLNVLCDVGLGYLQLGQPSNTLSGGEAQRLKLAAILGKPSKERTLYIFDEPTTGLHVSDVRVLLNAFQALLRHGHSIILIEHNLDVIRCSDYVIDIGPEGGLRGGHVVATGTPEQIAEVPQSHTGRFLRDITDITPYGTAVL